MEKELNEKTDSSIMKKEVKVKREEIQNKKDYQELFV